MTALLALDGVSRNFAGVRAVAGVSLAVSAGTVVAVAGPNGAGKTTLLDLIAGVHRPDSGTIRLAGQDITGWRPDRTCAAGIGRTFQPPRPFGGLTVEDSVVVAALLHEPEIAVARRRALELLEPLGLAPRCDQPAASLDFSGRKRLELARALATRPRLLLLDEPLAGLEPADRDDLAGFLRGLRGRRGLAILMAEQFAEAAAALADDIIRLDHGEIIDGTPP